jgi:hypothetical protein
LPDAPFRFFCHDAIFHFRHFRFRRHYFDFIPRHAAIFAAVLFSFYCHVILFTPIIADAFITLSLIAILTLISFH